MKKIVLISYCLAIQVALYSQESNNRLHVTSDIELIRLSENAYIHVSYTESPAYGRIGSNGLIFINNGEAFLFDTPMTDSLTKALVSYLRDSLQLNIIGFVPNHWHIDCMGGLKYINDQGIKSYANQLTIDIARSHNLPIPSVGFSDSMDLQLGDKLIQCYFPGAAHSLDNIVVWIPSEKILYTGCMVKSTNSNNLGNISDGDLKAYSNTIENLKNEFYDATIIIPGHGSHGGMELIDHTLGMAKKASVTN